MSRSVGATLSAIDDMGGTLGKVTRTMKAYDSVRVRQRLRPAESYDGWHVNQRPPQVGDVGTIVDILHAPGSPDRYVVECSSADGVSIWLGDFLAEELEPVSA